MNKPLTNVVICYGNEDEVVEYAKQLSYQSKKDLIKLIVVINKGDKGEMYLRNQLDKVGIEYDIKDPGHNLGYLNGLLCGASLRESSSEWFIFSNTDIIIPDKEMISSFVDNQYPEEENIWIVGPSVFSSAKNTYINPYLLDRPSKKSYVIRNIGMSFPYLYNLLFNLKWRFKSKHILLEQKMSGFVYAVHGSFFFINRHLIEILQTQNEWELLYDEEQYIAEVVRKYEKKEYYDSTMSVNHIDGSSTAKVNIKARYSRMKQSNKRLLEEFY